MPARHPAVAVAFGVLLALSCGKSPDGPKSTPVDSPSAPIPVPPALEIVAGAGLSDTIQATPNQQLAVRVWGPTGKPVRDVAVVFAVGTVACQDWRVGYRCLPMRVAPAFADSFAGSAFTTTDADGRAAVRLRMDTLVGPASVKITVPAYALVDSAAFTVLPGGPFEVRALLRDTAVDLGGTFVPRAGVVDRAGNLRSEPVTFEATSAAVQVSGTGSVLAVAIGRAYVRVRGTVGRITTDSVGITVVPNARVAYYGGGAWTLRLATLAGGAVRYLGDWAASSPAWSPTSDRIAYFATGERYPTYRYYTDPALAVIDTLGRVVAWTATPGVRWQNGPAYSPDGLWIYFYRSNGVYGDQVFRVHPDGTGLEALQGPTERGAYPSPSPDGTRFAYSSFDHLLVKTLATGHVDTLVTASVSHTRWSPDGKWIAYIDDDTRAIGLVQPDGSGQRHIAASVDPSGLTWSPDSKWLLAVDSSRLVLVEVTAGTIYRLTTPGYEPAWQP